tara:strand:+ start:51 stop:458 length:408 start_codon:yes stop_codon:yes gene_type:complete
MVDTLNFDLVSPERSVASFSATEVQIPGSEGEMTVMPNHALVLTTLRPGVLSVGSIDGVTDYVVTGGFAEVTASGVTVLAERAIIKSDITQSDLNGIISSFKADLDNANEEMHDASRKAYADVIALAAALGMSVA